MELEIIIILQDVFLPMDIQVTGNLVYIRKEGKTLHTFDMNTLKYYHEINELNNHLKEITT
jgi:hypothetical protein